MWASKPFTDHRRKLIFPPYEIISTKCNHKWSISIYSTSGQLTSSPVLTIVIKGKERITKRFHNALKFCNTVVLRKGKALNFCGSKFGTEDLCFFLVGVCIRWVRVAAHLRKFHACWQFFLQEANTHKYNNSFLLCTGHMVVAQYCVIIILLCNDNFPIIY